MLAFDQQQLLARIFLRASTSRHFAVRRTPFDDPNYNPPAPDVVNDKPTVWRKAASVLKKSSNILKPWDRTPLSHNFPSIDGTHEVDHDVTMKQRLKEAQLYIMQEYKVCMKEFRRNNRKFGDFARLPERHNELRLLFDFKNRPEDFEQWYSGCDSDANLGYSTCNMMLSKTGTLKMNGMLDKTLPKDGITTRTGYAAIATKLRKKSFDRPITWFEELQGYTHLAIKLRGDGRVYNLVLRTAQEKWDFTWGDSYMYPIYTHGGPYWQIATVPFSRLISVTGSRVASDQMKIQLPRVRTFGLTLADRSNGPFELELAWIGAFKDCSHFEKFAYEKYNLQPEGAEWHL